MHACKSVCALTKTRASKQMIPIPPAPRGSRRNCSAERMRSVGAGCGQSGQQALVASSHSISEKTLYFSIINTRGFRACVSGSDQLKLRRISSEPHTNASFSFRPHSHFGTCFSPHSALHVWRSLHQEAKLGFWRPVVAFLRSYPITRGCFKLLQGRHNAGESSLCPFNSLLQMSVWVSVSVPSVRRVCMLHCCVAPCCSAWSRRSMPGLCATLFQTLVAAVDD